jgi:hypothetical protein
LVRNPTITAKDKSGKETVIELEGSLMEELL